MDDDPSAQDVSHRGSAQSEAAGLHKSKEVVEERLLSLTRALNEDRLGKLREGLNLLSDKRCAHLLESSPPRARQLLWSLLEDDREAGVLAEISNEARLPLISKMGASELATLLTRMDPDEQVEALETLPRRTTSEVLQQMSSRDRKRIEEQLLWPAGTVGTRMTVDIPSLRLRDHVQMATQYIAEYQDLLNSGLDLIPVVDRDGCYLGSVPIGRLLTASRSDGIRDLMQTNIQTVLADADPDNLMALFENNRWSSVPVVDANNTLVGIVEREQVVTFLEEFSDSVLRKQLHVGEDTFASIWTSGKQRFVWLLANLGTAFLATSVIGAFKEILDQLVVLAILMPIVASMGGIAATQTLTIVIRGMALGQIHTSNIFWLFNREVWVAVACGAILGLLVGFWSNLWFGSLAVSLIMGSATALNILVAAVAGVLIPVLSQRIKIDPTVSGAVVVTTITDVAGFTIFLGGATILLSV